MFQIDPGKTQIVKLLTYSGTLPLLLCVTATLLPVSAVDPVRIALCYCAVIASFLCGIHWAVYLLLGDRCRRNLLLYSNAIALAAWLALLIVPPCLALCLLGLCFLALLKLDNGLVACAIYSAWYGTLRRNATIIVMLSLFALIAEVYFR
jgi:hypothetical protein